MGAICSFFADTRLRIRHRIFILPAVLALAGCATSTSTPDTASLQQFPPEYRQEVVMVAMSLMGSPYRFDCSGLVNYVFGRVTGNRLPRTADSQAKVSRRISRSELREGDLVFFNTLGRPNSHVGIYIGSGQFVNAPSSGGRVRIDTLDNPYFAKRFDSARTLFASR
jgi:cell wall-associated NlpC family hydrolase